MTHRFPIYLAAVVLFVSCAVVPPERPTTPQKPARPGTIPETTRPSRPADPPGAELELEHFSRLPSEAKSYLASISRAFADGNTLFLLDQGEESYDSRLRDDMAPETYAALLYRVGNYSSDSPDGGGKPIRVELAEAAEIRYTGWTERGPVVEVRGRLRFRNGKETPCSLYVLWKLEPPKILGYEP